MLGTGLDLASPTRGVRRLATLGPQHPGLRWLSPCQRPLGLLLGTTVDTPHPFVIGRRPGGLGSPCWPQPVLQKVQPTCILGIQPSTTPRPLSPAASDMPPPALGPPLPIPPCPLGPCSTWQASHGTLTLCDPSPASHGTHLRAPGIPITGTPSQMGFSRV